MKNNSFLVLVQNSELVNDLRDNEHISFVYPLKFFSVGFINYFDSSQIPKSGYIYVNKALNNKDLKHLEEILNTHTYRGIIFDDLGIIELVKNLKMEKILYQPHQLANYESINEMLAFVDSVILTTDLTKEEIGNILEKSSKKICIYGLGFLSVMSSKRKLLSNYYEHYKLPMKKELNIFSDDKELLLVETPDGTVLYETPCYINNYYLNHDKVLYTFINSLYLNSSEVLDYMKSGKANILSSVKYLDHETVYKLKDGDGNA